MRVVYVAQAEPAWDQSRVSRGLQPRRSARSRRRHLRRPRSHEITLAVTNGSADKPDYALTLDRINVGTVRGGARQPKSPAADESCGVHRCRRRDQRDRLPRHAHIDCGESPASYRLFDDRSAQGTSIVRNGKTVSVPVGTRGVRLQSGDEIVLGEARLRVKIA